MLAMCQSRAQSSMSFDLAMPVGAPPAPMAPVPMPAADIARPKRAAAPGAGGGGLFKKLFGRSRDAATVDNAPDSAPATLAGGRTRLPGWLSTLAIQLTRQFAARPADVDALLAGRFSLDTLVQAPDVTMLNALDELAEKVQLELADGVFWQALVWALYQQLQTTGQVAAFGDLGAVSTRLHASTTAQQMLAAWTA